MNPFNAHAQFMEAGGQTIDCMNIEQAHLYWRLCHEEFGELQHAWLDFRSMARAVGDPHIEELRRKFLTETLDGIGDLIWVAAGMARSLGVDPDRILRVIGESNLSKIDPLTGNVKKRDDGKIMKPEGYRPPNLRPLAEAAMEMKND